MLFQEPWRCFCNFQSCSLFCRFSWCWNIQTPVMFYILSFLHVWSWVTSLWFEVSAPRRSVTHRWPHGENVMGKIWNMKWFSWRAEPKSPTKHLEDTDLQRYTKSPLLTFFPSFFYWWDLIMSVCTTKRTAFNNWNAPKMQRRQRKSKPVVDMAVLWASCSAHLLPVWFELCNVSTKACQSSPTQHSGFLLGRLSAWRSGPVRSLVLVLGGVPLESYGTGWGVGGQMRVSWCQRLDGRMLSTFSMMKFRGANSVLRNCNNAEKRKVTETLKLFRSVWIDYLTFQSESVEAFQQK